MPRAPALKTILVAAMLGIGFAGAAEARNGQVFTAQLAQPVAERTQVIANSTLWTCEADTCRAVVRHESTVRACRLLVRETGAIVSYGPADAALSSDEIARCNGATDTARNNGTTATAVAQ